MSDMRVFISWSKAASKQFAGALRDWLPDVIQQLDPWMSTEDIQKGQRWSEELARQLQGIDEGIICVTHDNFREPWLNFEAGALAKASKGSVRPILLDLEPADLIGPLTSFQLSKATDKEDMKKLVLSLNNNCSAPLESNRLLRSFDRTWDDFLGKIEDIEKDGGAPPRRELEDMLGEVVQITRSLERRFLTILEQGELAIPGQRNTGILRSEGNLVEISNLTWRRSSQHKVDSGPEIAVLPSRLVAMRDSKDITKPAVVFEQDEWSQFVDDIKAGQYDFIGSR